MTVVVKFKKLTDTAKIPTRQSEHAAGFDLYATSYKFVDGCYVEYGTGIALEIPHGYVGKLYPRSSISNTGLILANSVGIIDSDYRGEIKFRFKPFSDNNYYTVGDRIGQIIIEKLESVKFVESNTLSQTVRDNNGFGSTGHK